MVLFSVVINSFVHVIMYSYYFAALFGPAVQRKLEGIKRNITLIQMVNVSKPFTPNRAWSKFKPLSPFFRSNSPSFSYNVPCLLHKAVMYQSCYSQFMCQMFCSSSSCFTISSRRRTKRKPNCRKRAKPTRAECTHKFRCDNAFRYRNNFQGLEPQYKSFATLSL